MVICQNVLDLCLYSIGVAVTLYYAIKMEKWKACMAHSAHLLHQLLNVVLWCRHSIRLSSSYFRPDGAVNIRTHSSLLRWEQVCSRHAVRKMKTKLQNKTPRNCSSHLSIYFGSYCKLPAMCAIVKMHLFCLLKP